MIKINLLPRTIGQKRIVRNTAILMGCILVLVIAVGVAYGFRLKGEVAREEQLAAETEAWKAKVEGIQKQAQEVRSQTKPIQEKLDFINQVLDYNLEYPKLYEKVARWTYEKVSLSGMQCDGQQVVLRAHVKSLDDLGRYLLNMYRAVDLFTEVAISGIPGYGQVGGQQPFSMPSMPGPGGGEIGGSMAGLAGIQAIETGVERAAEGVYAASGINFTVTCRLRTPIVAPQFGGAPTEPGAAGMPGMPATGGPMTPMGEPMSPMPMRGAPGEPPPPTPEGM